MSQLKRQVKLPSGYRYPKKELLARARDLSALLTIAETATQSLDVEKILNDTLDKSLEILGFDLGFIRILDSAKGGMVVWAARGLSSPEFLQGVAPIDSEKFGRAKKIGRAHV